MKSRAPAHYAEVHRHSVVTLARLEKEAFLHLRNIVRVADGHLLTLLQYQDENGTYRAIQKAATSLQDELEDAIVDVRAEARKSSHEALLLEIEHLRDDLDEEVEDPSIEHWTERDVAHAHAAAASFKAAWMAAVTAAAIRAFQTGENVSEAVAYASRQQDYRIARIARSETASAYATAREDATDELAETHKDTDWVPIVFKRWDAILDAKVCPVCRGMDGTIVPIGFDFDEPLPNHTNCRCVTTIVYLPIPLTSENTGTE